MYQSILQFCDKGIINLDDITAKFFENPTDIAGFRSFAATFSLLQPASLITIRLQDFFTLPKKPLKTGKSPCDVGKLVVK